MPIHESKCFQPDLRSDDITKPTPSNIVAMSILDVFREKNKKSKFFHINTPSSVTKESAGDKYA
jgi:hypothetical protein